MRLSKRNVALFYEVTAKGISTMWDLSNDRTSLPIVQDRVHRSERNRRVLFAAQRNSLYANPGFIDDLLGKVKPGSRARINDVVDAARSLFFEQREDGPSRIRRGSGRHGDVIHDSHLLRFSAFLQDRLDKIPPLTARPGDAEQRRHTRNKGSIAVLPESELFAEQLRRTIDVERSGVIHLRVRPLALSVKNVVRADVHEARPADLTCLCHGSNGMCVDTKCFRRVRFDLVRLVVARTIDQDIESVLRENRRGGRQITHIQILPAQRQRLDAAICRSSGTDDVAAQLPVCSQHRDEHMLTIPPYISTSVMIWCQRVSSLYQSSVMVCGVFWSTPDSSAR